MIESTDLANEAGKPVRDCTDWAALRAMSESDIERTAAEDEENPATDSDDEWAHAPIALTVSEIARA